MTLALDMSSDLTDCYDFQEPITYIRRRTSGGGDVFFSIPSAVRAQPTEQERAPSGGVYAGFDQSWLIPNAAFLAIPATPKPADTITDGQGQVWTVLNTNFDELDSVWRLSCIDLILANDLRNTADIYAPTNLQDAGAARVPTFAVVYSAQPIRLEEEAGDVTTERGKRGTKRRYTAYLLNNITVTVGHRLVIVGGAGAGATIYTIIGFAKASRIDELQTLTCELTPP